MYIDRFLAGVLATLIVEFSILFVIAIISDYKQKQQLKNKNRGIE